MRAWGLNVTDLLTPHFWMRVPGDADARDLFLHFRPSMCGAHTNGSVLGDSLSVNGRFNIPLTRAEALKQGFVLGNCIGKVQALLRSLFAAQLTSSCCKLDGFAHVV